MGLESIIYRERVWLGQWTSIAFGLLIGIFIPLIALQIFAGSREPHLLGFYLAMDLFFFILFINFRRLDVIIYPSKILVSFGLIRKGISVSDVSLCEPIRASLGVYAGYGIRYGGDGSLAFTTSFGDAVRLRLRSGRPFVFSTNRQRQVIEIIQKLISADRSIYNILCCFLKTTDLFERTVQNRSIDASQAPPAYQRSLCGNRDT